MADDQNREQRDNNVAVIWARYSEIAFIIPASVTVGLLVGKLLDYWLHTKRLFLVGIVLGAGLGFVQMIRMVTRSGDKMQ